MGLSFTTTFFRFVKSNVSFWLIPLCLRLSVSSENPHFDPHLSFFLSFFRGYLKVSPALTLSCRNRSPTAMMLMVLMGWRYRAQCGHKGLAQLSAHGAITQGRGQLRVEADSTENDLTTLEMPWILFLSVGVCGFIALRPSHSRN